MATNTRLDFSHILCFLAPLLEERMQNLLQESLPYEMQLATESERAKRAISPAPIASEAVLAESNFTDAIPESTCIIPVSVRLPLASVT